MKFIRVSSRLALLSLAAAGIAWFTGIYGDSVRIGSPNPGWQAERRHRPSEPEAGWFPEFVGEGIVVAIFAVGGRIVLRLRLSSASRTEEKPILLGLSNPDDYAGECSYSFPAAEAGR